MIKEGIVCCDFVKQMPEETYFIANYSFDVLLAEPKVIRHQTLQTIKFSSIA